MDISHIVVLHNRLASLPALLRALLGQTRHRHQEILLIDNASTDGSRAWLEQAAANEPSVRIMAFEEYGPPGLRLHQGIEAARGVWLHLIEASGIPPVNLCDVLLPMAIEHFADGVHGSLSEEEADTLTTMSSHPDFRLWDAPMEAMLDRQGPHLSLFCRAELYARAGGVDPRLPLGDHTLPLRLAAVAQRWMTLDTPLSAHVPGMPGRDLFDLFFAYRFALKEMTLTPKQRQIMQRRALSAALRATRDKGDLWAHPLFMPHLRSLWPFGAVRAEDIETANELLLAEKERAHGPKR